MVIFNTRMRPEVIQSFWAALQAGEFISAAAEGVVTYRVKGRRWILAESGVRPRRGRHLKGRCLTFCEREEIALGRARGESVRCIARQLGRASSTVSRELSRNTDRRSEYRATSAHARRGSELLVPSRPSSGSTSDSARSSRIYGALVLSGADRGRLRVQFPADPEMWVSTETIYQSLYVTFRGASRRVAS